MAPEKNYQNTAINAIHEIVHGSLCMAIGNFNDLLNTGTDYDKYEPLKAIKDDLFDIYLNLEDVLSDDDLDSENRNKYKQKCYDHRNMLADINLRMGLLQNYRGQCEVR